MKNLLTRKKLIELEEKMVGFGPRLTGSEAHKEYIRMLKDEMRSYGFKIYSDTLNMKKRWEPKRLELIIKSGNDVRKIKKISYYPYSGQTPPSGVKGRLCYCGKGYGRYLKAKGKIAVVEVPVFSVDVGLAFKKRGVYPSDAKLPQKVTSPMISTFVLFPIIKAAKLAGAKAVICVMTGCSYANSANQYLPFLTTYQDCPALWVNGPEGKRILELSKKEDACANLTLEATLEENTHTETFFAVLPGKSKTETILVNTHTDGVNAFEENGGIGLLSLAKYFSSKPIEERERTIVFSFVTGHMQLMQFNKGINQASWRFLNYHNEYWKGGRKCRNAVAAVTIEHLGCSEWRDFDGVLKKLNKIEPELVYTSNDKLSDLYISCLKGRNHVRTLTLRPKNFIYFGEGQPFYASGIPCISLVPGPDYLCGAGKSGYIERVNYDLMYEQIATFANVIEKLDKMSEKEIGHNDFLSFGVRL